MNKISIVFSTLLVFCTLSLADTTERTELEVDRNAAGQITAIRWKSDVALSEAVTPELLEIITADPQALYVSPNFSHALVKLPFGTEGALMGDVVLLRPGVITGLPKPGEGIIGQSPTAISLNRWGFYYTRNSGSVFTVEHYDLVRSASEILQTLDAGQVGTLHNIKLSEDVVTIISGGTSIDYRPNKRRAQSTLIFSALARDNIDTIEGSFGGINLTKRALDGQLDPDESESALAIQMAENIHRSRTQRSVLLWGIPGSDTQGVVHLFAQRVAEAKEGDKHFGWFAGWRVYQMSWANLNTEGYVDVSSNKTIKLINATRQRKVILFFDQAEQLIGLGSNKDYRSDVASVLLGSMKSGEVIIIGATTSDGMPTMRSNSEMFSRFFEIPLPEAKGDRLLAKLRLSADRKRDESRVNFSDESLKKIVAVSDKYLSDRGQPEKSLAGIEALITEFTPLRHLDPAIDPETVPFRDITENNVMSWISKAARIGSLSIDGSEALAKFVLTQEYSDAMNRRMSGQNGAKEAVRDALLAIAKGNKKTNSQGKEVGIETLLMVGPSGSGKSYIHQVLSKVLAEKDILLPYEEPMEGSVLIDGDQAVRTLLGAAPGYIGFDPSGEGGLLYQKVKRSPQAILVLEEFDKVHPSIDLTLYSFLDEGKVQNVTGKVAWFTRGLFILTANFGVTGSGGSTNRNGAAGPAKPAQCDYIDRWDRHHLFPVGDPLHIDDPMVANWTEEGLRAALFTCLQTNQLLNPQILGRIGRSNLVIFHHLTRADIQTIRDQEIAKLAKEYLQTHDAKLEFTPEFLQWLFDFAWGVDGMLTFNSGARGIVDAVKAEVSKPLLKFAALGGDPVKSKTWKIELTTNPDQAKVSVK